MLQLGQADGSNNFRPYLYNERTTSILSMRCKKSSRWHDVTEPVTKYPLEFIDKRGRFSQFTFAFWETKFSCILTTYISTIFDRLSRKYRLKKDEKFVRDHCDELVACATIYAMTRNEHFFNKFQFLLKHKHLRSSLKGFLIHSVSKLDKNTRFVFCQVWKQTHWLSSRSKTLSDSARRGRRTYPIFDLRKLNPPSKFIWDPFRTIIRKYGSSSDIDNDPDFHIYEVKLDGTEDRII